MARPTDHPPADAPEREDAPPPRGAGPSGQNPPPGRGGYPRRPPRAALARRPLPPPEPATQQRAWAALTLGVLSVLGSAVAGGLRRPVYVYIVTLLIGALAAWLGGSAIAQARRGGTARPRGAIGGIVLGCLGIAFSAFGLIFLAVFWKELSAYSNCLSGANTLSAQHACQHQFDQSIINRIRSVPPSG
jgi:hypothetical protein